MRKLIIGLAILLALFLGLLFIAPSLVPSETYRVRIQEQLTKELGREVELSGDVKLSTFPVIKAQTDGVRVANPLGFTDANFATLDGLDARIRLLPLLSRRVEIKSFVLREPLISLERRADGQTNWTFSDGAEVTPDPPANEGPFRRDGRFTNIDPGIQAFTIENGTVRYADRVTGQTLAATDINTFLSLPGLASMLVIDGDLQLEGRPLSVDMRMDSPGAFLSGQAATLIGDLKTDGAVLSVDGQFPAGEDIAFQGDVNTTLDDIVALQSALGPLLSEELAKIDGLEALETAALRGTIDYTPSRTSLSDSIISITGPALNGRFEGDASYDGTPLLNGRLDLQISDAQALAPLLPEPVPGLAAMKTASLTADLRAEGENAFVIENANIQAAGPAFNATYQGTGRYNNTLSLDGTFDANISDTRALISQAGLTIEPSVVQDAAVAGAVNATGAVRYDGKTASVTDLVVSSDSDVQTTRYSGSIQYAKAPRFEGTLNSTIPSLSAINAALSTEIPYADAIDRISVDTQLSGSLDDLRLSSLRAEMTDGALNGDFTGSASFSETNGLGLNGKLNAKGDSLRELARLSGTDLPPATEAGPIFETFALGGDVSGTATNIQLSDATVSLDQISGNGDFAVTMANKRPKLTGTLNVGALDLRPYMSAYSAQQPSGEIQPWSDDPLPVEPLRAVDVDLDLNATSVKVSRLSLGATTLNVTLQNGRLVADLPNLRLYSGAGTANLVYDASQDMPRFSLTAGLNAVESEGFLGAIAGFTQATGKAGTTLELSGTGRSQAELMQSLNGDGLYKLIDGSIQGIDAAQFLTGLDTALQSRALPAGIGPSYSTSVSELLGGFSVKNGVATIDSFSMAALGVSADASGQVDLGAQTIDFRFRPKATGTQASGLAAFGIPLRFSGPFGAAKPSLDSEFLGEIVEAKARAEAQKLITDRVGGPVGGIVGGLIGGNNGTQSSGTETQTGAASGSIDQVLGGLLSGGQQSPSSEGEEPAAEATPDETPEEEKAEEESVEDALLGLFGVKRED